MLQALVTQKVMSAVVRHVMTAAGVWMASKGVEADAATVEAVSGGVVALVGLGWSVLEKAGRR